MFFTASIGFALLSAGAPVFQLDCEVESLVLRASHEPAVFSRFTQRIERAASGDVRITFIEDGVKTIQTFTSKRITTEAVRPDGTRQSVEAPIASEKNPWVPLMNEAKSMGYKELSRKEPKEYKTIAGIRCSKHVRVAAVGDYTLETVEWTSVDGALAGRLPALEKYDYTVDGEDKKLAFASIATSVKLGKTPARRS